MRAAAQKLEAALGAVYKWLADQCRGVSASGEPRTYPSLAVYLIGRVAGSVSASWPGADETAERFRQARYGPDYGRERLAKGLADGKRDPWTAKRLQAAARSVS